MPLGECKVQRNGYAVHRKALPVRAPLPKAIVADGKLSAALEASGAVPSAGAGSVRSQRSVSTFGPSLRLNAGLMSSLRL